MSDDPEAVALPERARVAELVDCPRPERDAELEDRGDEREERRA